ncbi:hypothetical protein EDB85DRAFT_1888644 [Lactarius pseudohatsudake]|nr:hypothetical protein EDB85DRAFT_1888644 [Lactarius pseudohatsudake]
MSLEWASLCPQQLQMTLGWIHPCLLWQEGPSGAPRQHAVGVIFTDFWEWGKCAPPSSASDVPEGHGVANSEALQEMGDWGNFGMDGPPSPTAQDDFGMDLALPTEARECVEIPSGAHTQDVEYTDSFGMDVPPSPMAQDNFGMDSPISPGVHAQGTGPAPSQQDGLLDEGTRVDLSLPTEAGEHVGIPSAAHIAKLSGHPPSPNSSQIQEGQDGESSEVLQEVQVQHAPELVLQDEFDVGTWAAILRAEGARLRRIHGQVWNIYQQEKEMSEVIDNMIDELDNAEEQDLRKSMSVGLVKTIGSASMNLVHIHSILLSPFETIGDMYQEKCKAHWRSLAAYLWSNAGPI